MYKIHNNIIPIIEREDEYRIQTDDFIIKVDDRGGVLFSKNYSLTALFDSVDAFTESNFGKRTVELEFRRDNKVIITIEFEIIF